MLDAKRKVYELKQKPVLVFDSFGLENEHNNDVNLEKVYMLSGRFKNLNSLTEMFQ